MTRARKRAIREQLGTDQRVVAWLVKLSARPGWKCSGGCTYAVPDGEQTNSGKCPWCVLPLERSEPPRKVNMRELAAMCGVGESKVAVAMKYAVAQGYAARVKDPEGQAAWFPAEKAIAEFPLDGQHVVKEPDPVDLGRGQKFKGIAAGPGTAKTFTRGTEGWEPADAAGRTLEPGEYERPALPPAPDEDTDG